MLPKIAVPKFKTKLPSDGEEVWFRMFSAREEKTLLIAAESKDEAQMVKAMTDIVESCADLSRPAASLPFFDLEHLFMHVRAKSVGEAVNLEYQHPLNQPLGGSRRNQKNEDCSGITKVSFRLDEVRCDPKPGHSKTVRFSAGDISYVVRMRYPTSSQFIDYSADRNENRLLAGCIESVAVGDEVHLPDSLADALGFVDSLPSPVLGDFVAFFSTLPVHAHAAVGRCGKCGEERTFKFEGIADFF